MKNQPQIRSKKHFAPDKLFFTPSYHRYEIYAENYYPIGKSYKHPKLNVSIAAKKTSRNYDFI